jgi:Holliday junction resolvasome RuvABC endonuclease subunit
MSLLLALDLGTTTGWALLATATISSRVNSGSQSFKTGRFDGGGMRYLRFANWLDEIKGSHEVVRVAFEEVRRHQGVDAAHAYGGFMATLTRWCESQDPKVPYEGVPVGTIKKLATGKGNAGKPEMLKWARDNGFAPVDDNEADALALLHWMMTNETARTALQRPAPDREPEGRVPVGAVQVAARRHRQKGGEDAADAGRPHGRERLSPVVADESARGRRRRAVLVGR